MCSSDLAVWRDGELEFIVDEMEAETDNRFNDVIADPAGRVFCGTMPTDTRPATLYRMDIDGSITTALEGVGLSNGMGFSPDLKQMYYTDSLARTIYIFDMTSAQATSPTSGCSSRLPMTGPFPTA